MLTVKAKRDAARAIVDPLPDGHPPADAADFMFSTGAWANKPDGTTTTGLDNVDLWVGGLGEVTNLNGGLLGSTFNYVFQNTLENLQDFDRLYYLNRTPGMNLRTQLEGNSFAEMIERNTDGTHTLKADAFATADCKFELGQPRSPAPAGSAITGAGSVADDPNTRTATRTCCSCSKPDGTIQYRARNTVDPSGINGQSVYNGTAVVDRIFGGNDNDTLWGNEGNDILEGNGGDDDVLGGDGNDIITDLDGADVLKGGDGNDAIDGGPGRRHHHRRQRRRTSPTAARTTTRRSPVRGNDFINAGQGADAVFGDGGDDWIQGGTGQDLLQGDHGAPFFDDPGETQPGNDIFVGQAGENDYDAEGGDDIMEQNPADRPQRRRRRLGLGDPRVRHRPGGRRPGDQQPARRAADPGRRQPRPLAGDGGRLRRSPFNDMIKGDDDDAGHGRRGRVHRLRRARPGGPRPDHRPGAIVPSLATAGVNGVVTAQSVADVSATGVVPAVGQRLGRRQHPARRRWWRHHRGPRRERHHRRRPGAPRADQRPHGPGEPGDRDRLDRPHGGQPARDRHLRCRHRRA